MPKGAPVVKSLREGALCLDIRKYGDGRFGFDYTPSGEFRRKIRLHSLADAVDEARELLGAGVAGKLGRHGVDEEQFKEFLQFQAKQRAGATVPELVASFVAAKTGKGRSAHHIRRLRKDLESFATAFPVHIDKLARADVEAWLNSRTIGPRRWNNIRESVVALYRFARREAKLSGDLKGAELIEKKEVKVVVKTYTPAEFQRLLNVVPEQWLPLIVLCGLCGLRPMEVCPDQRNGGDKPALQWSNILWAKKKIDVPAEVSKVRRRRFVPISDAAMAFLAPYRHATGPVVPQMEVYKFTGEWAVDAEIEWKHDALRHSYASYKLALTHDMAALALEMGNSPAMIFRHYLDLKHEDEATAWFEVHPSAKSSKSSKSKTLIVRTK